MRCPVCEAENPDDSASCASCGRTFASHAPDAGEPGALEGLEMTQAAAQDLPGPVEPLAGLEHTRLEEEGAVPSQWTGGPLALERTRHEVDGAAQGAWAGEVDVDRGREPDSGERTPAPAETATCPWCGTPSLGAVCDTCGRRKSRFAAPPPEGERRAKAGEIVTCPACFARVAREVRCSDCGMPFPLQEL